MSGIRQWSNTEWIRDDFVVWPYSDPYVYLGSELSKVSRLQRVRERLQSSFMSSGMGIGLENVVFDDKFNYDGKPHFPESFGVIHDLVCSFVERIAGDGELLTLVRRGPDGFKEYGAFQEEEDLLDGGDYCVIPSVSRGFLSRLWVLLDLSRWEKPTRLLLTRKAPAQVPDFHLRAVASLCPLPGESNALYHKLVTTGIQSFGEDDFNRCRFFVIIGVYGTYCEHASVSVVHHPEDADFVRAAVHEARSEAAIRVQPEWQLGKLAVDREVPPSDWLVLPWDSPLGEAALLNAYSILIRPFLEFRLPVSVHPDIDEPIASVVPEQCGRLSEWTSSLAEYLSKGGPILTIVGGDHRRCEETADFAGAPGYQAIQPVPVARPSLLRRLLLLTPGPPNTKGEPLWLTRRRPADIPGYALRTVVSLCPGPEDEDRIHEKLMRAGLLALTADDFKACTTLLVPSFYCAGCLNEAPAVSIIFRRGDAEFVAGAMEAVAAMPGSPLKRWR